MKKTMMIEGMSCDHCKSMVERVLGKIDGVTNVVVNLADKSAEVTMDRDVPNDVLAAAVTDAGYTVIDVR